jgi:hypothetical protein
MSVQHTPGPWRLSHEADTQVEAERNGNFIASCDGGGEDGEYETDLANARLIAAAPDLLRELQHAVRWFDQIKPDDVARYRAAIAKATGKAPYNAARVAWELERTAMGDGYYGNALRVAKDIPGLTDDDRALLDRYATGRNAGTDHVALQDLALRIDAIAKVAGSAA